MLVKRLIYQVAVKKPPSTNKTEQTHPNPKKNANTTTKTSFEGLTATWFAT